MAVKVPEYAPITVDIGATNVTEILAGDDVRVVWVRGVGALWLTYGFPDGTALPTAARFPIAAGEAWPIEIGGAAHPAVTSQTGTTAVSFLGGN
jgi:hypothetical protein